MNWKKTPESIVVKPATAHRPRRLRHARPASARQYRLICMSLSLSAGLLAMLVATPRAWADTVPGKPADKLACLNITAYGAQADGSDVTQAIQAAINDAQTRPGSCVYIPRGVFFMTYLTVDGVKLIGDGIKSILHTPAPTGQLGRVTLSGSGGGLYDLEIHMYGTERTNLDSAVWIESGASTWVIDNITIDGGNGGGIITFGSHDGRITRNRVYNTKSDSIHMSGGAYNIYVAGNKVRNSGDDMIAIVTYQYHPVNTHDILIENNNLANQPWGRGISVVGGDNVTIRNNKINASSDAGIYIAAESSWATRGDNNILVKNNRLNLTPNAHLDHGQSSIEIYSDNDYQVQNVAVLNNVITNAANGAIFVGSANVSNISCQNDSLDGQLVWPANCSGDPIVVTGTTVTARLLGGGTVAIPQ